MRNTLYWIVGEEVVYADVSFTSFYSVFNSPYPAHERGAAVDLYFNDGEALFPFEEGVVMDIRWYNAPRNRVDAMDKEPLILIQLSPTIVAKILHVYPKVRIGEHLFLGDPVGELIVSGFMYPWSEKHMHLEVRPLWDPVRASGASNVRILRAISIPATSRIEGTIIEKNKYYVLVKPESIVNEGLTPLVIRSGDNTYSVDGGIPHYSYAGLITSNTRNNGTVLNLGAYNALLVRVKQDKSTLMMNKCVYKGVSTYINRPYIKLVLEENNHIDLKEGDIIVEDSCINLKSFINT